MSEKCQKQTSPSWSERMCDMDFTYLLKYRVARREAGDCRMSCPAISQESDYL